MKPENLLPNESEVKIFMKNFRDKSVINLEQIQKSDKYTEAAKEAAKRLLNQEK